MTGAVLIVEDEPTLARSLARGLADDAEVIVATTAADAAAMHTEHRGRIAVAIVDVSLPDGDGLELARTLRLLDPTLAIVTATGADDPRTAERAIAVGVQGYLVKPFKLSELRINVANARRWRTLEQAARREHDELERLVAARTRQLRESQWETIRRLAMAAEQRDQETGAHLDRMSAYSAILARRAGLAPEHCERIRIASPMHDIGKIGIADDVLTHDGPFDESQRAAMRRHAMIGWQILSGSSSAVLETAAVIARTHHEWWDGSGYPEGLRGERIPVEGRIVAIADVFDALTSERRYKPAFTLHETVSMMRSERGSHFDPHLLDLLLDDLDELLFVRDAHPDELADEVLLRS